jgi:hypothetical protein
MRGRRLGEGWRLRSDKAKRDRERDAGREGDGTLSPHIVGLGSTFMHSRVRAHAHKRGSKADVTLPDVRFLPSFELPATVAPSLTVSVHLLAEDIRFSRTGGEEKNCFRKNV